MENTDGQGFTRAKADKNRLCGRSGPKKEFEISDFEWNGLVALVLSHFFKKKLSRLRLDFGKLRKQSWLLYEPGRSTTRHNVEIFL
jgi:hypothetical protein